MGTENSEEFTRDMRCSTWGFSALNSSFFYRKDSTDKKKSKKKIENNDFDPMTELKVRQRD